MKLAKQIVVHAVWDDEAHVWVATSDDVPGLVTEADTAELLEAKLKVLIPELLIENGLITSSEHQEIPFHLLAERDSIAQCR
ncbi:MAG: DUF1902 domain-containing protein [Gammaproteobacteria bacterium]